MTSLHLHNYSLFKTERQIKRISFTVFRKMNVQCRYKYLVLWRDKSYFMKEKNRSDATKKFSEAECLIDNIFVIFGWRVFHWQSELCSSSRRLVHLFVWDRLHTGVFQLKQKKLARSFNFAFRYVNDLLSLNKSIP